MRETSPRPWTLDVEAQPRPHIRDAHGRVIAAVMSREGDGELIVRAVNREEQFLPAALSLKNELSELCTWLTDAGFATNPEVRKARQVLISEEIRALGRKEIVE